MILIALQTCKAFNVGPPRY